jgi:NADH:ubiquinone oxidoreductase subunit 6 (subunit J)
MGLYASFLGGMSFLFVGTAVVLVVMSLSHLRRRHTRKAVLYLALTLLACLVAAGFQFFRGLMAS